MSIAAPSLLSRRLSRGQLLAFDVVLAAATALLCVLAAIEPPPASSAGWHEPGWASVIAGVLLAVPVALRRPWPITATVVAILLATTVLITAVIPFYAGVAPTVVVGLVLYTVGVDLSRRRSIATVVVCVVVIAAALLSESHQFFGSALVAWALGACWTVGRTIRERRAFAARTVEQSTAIAVDQERLRIARELHDIVSHSMSMIAVKATVADHVADTHPQEMRAALQVISATSRETLIELRRALGILRTEAAFAPAPGLTELAGLVAATRSAGVTVDLRVSGEAALPEAVASATFRIVQEALTNVVKHAREAACRVEVDVGSAVVRISVADDGVVPALGAGPAAGQGLIGMRERAALFGGSDFTAGPVPGGGWAVATTLRYAS